MVKKLYKRLVGGKPIVDSGEPIVVSRKLLANSSVALLPAIGYQLSAFAVYRLVLLLIIGLWISAFSFHPYYMSVTEVEFKAAEKEVQISSKIFIDDLEYALEQEYKTKVEILNASDQKRNEMLLTSFFQRHLKFTIDGKPIKVELIGFEREGEAVWSYLVIKNVSKLKSATVFSDLLYAYREDQINIIHLIYKNQRKSHRLTHPAKQVNFTW